MSHLVEAELSEGAAGFHHEAHGRAVVEKRRDMAVRYPLRGDFDIRGLGGLGTDRVGTGNEVAVDPPMEREELSGL